ncbi:MAG TPA: glutamate mutase L [Bellilinea sp.]|nr:glutamate mutase L [Bellilinea sp.]
MAAESFNECRSVLAVDLGSLNTRAFLFDQVEGHYRFIGSTRLPAIRSISGHTVKDDVVQVVRRLQETVKYKLLDGDRIICPAKFDGSGVDQFILTHSLGDPIKTVILGGMKSVSVVSGIELAGTAPLQIVDTVDMMDPRSPSEQLDAFVENKPELVIIAGGTEEGATKLVARQADIVSWLMQLLPAHLRPKVFFTGNEAMQHYVADILARWTSVESGSNVRPTVVESDLTRSMARLAETVSKIRMSQFDGLDAIASQSASVPLPNSFTFGRFIRFLNQVNPGAQSFLGVNIGSQFTTVCSADGDQFHQRVLPFAAGKGIESLMEKVKPGRLDNWLAGTIPLETVRDYLWQKSIHPAVLPASADSALIEDALLRVLLRQAMVEFYHQFPQTELGHDTILVTGLPFSQYSNRDALSLVLDGMQPSGVTSIVLDQYEIAPILGQAATVNKFLPVHMIESNAFVNLGTVIAPISSARVGSPLIRLKLQYEDGEQAQLEILQGTLTQLPVQPGQMVQLNLSPIRPFMLDRTHQQSARNFMVVGGACGVVIDTRGRPIQLAADEGMRRAQLSSWKMALAG